VNLWLRSLGLERCEASFPDNDADRMIVPKLTPRPSRAAETDRFGGTNAIGVELFPRAGAGSVCGWCRSAGPERNPDGNGYVAILAPRSSGILGARMDTPCRVS
jgi:hypothetical protein